MNPSTDLCNKAPRGRLIAAEVSAAIMVSLGGFWIESVGVPGMDLLFAWTPLAILITVFWSSGLCHAFNLIDGVNGLAGSTSILVSAGIAAIAWFAGDTEMALLAAVMVPAISGFQLLNWPKGRIFLGDGGAYSIGHLLAWLGIVVAVRNPGVAGISLALLYFWPVADTLWAIYRRAKNGARTDQPDRMHFHQLVMRTLEIRFGLRGRRHISNSLTSFVLSPVIAVPVIVGVAFYEQPLLGLVSMVALSLAFVGLYLSVYGFAAKKPKKQVGSPPEATQQNARIPAE